MYIKKTNNKTQSISAKGSSVDNVPIESFFSALKSECIYLIKNLKVKEIDQTIIILTITTTKDYKKK